MPIPRPEHPKPQFEREDWINLNGPWSYSFDFGKSGLDRGLAAAKGFPDFINVPFCPESRLSGVGRTDFIEMMWYHRQLEVPAGWEGKRVLLHFGGVDWECEAFIDGQPAGAHWGGTVSFSFDVTRFVKPGARHELVLMVKDDTRSGRQPGGKQSPEFGFKRKRCHYTRTTGIWSTVWLEAVHPAGLRDVRIIPDLDAGRFVLVPRFRALQDGLRFKAVVSEGKRSVAEAGRRAADGLPVEVVLPSPKAWAPGSPFLYELEFQVLDSSGRVLDRVKSYAGLRKIHIEGNKIFLNNRPLYQRLVLDQGYYPDGIWTAPSDADLKKDIELAMAAGFNGARLHQKVFEERFHYWADRLGYLTWGETASWGLHATDETSARNILAEWREIIERDRNHPSIIAWTGLNETRFIAPNPAQQRRLTADLYELAKSLDPTRPMHDASGYIHVRTDLWSVHNYTQDPAELKAAISTKPESGVYRCHPDWEPPYEGQPYIMAEFGGIWWVPPGKPVYMETSWGYGNKPASEDEFYRRLEGQVEAVLSLGHICGYCYTQLTDVEQEQNGIYNFDRSEKFDMKRIRAAFSRLPEQQGVS